MDGNPDGDESARSSGRLVRPFLGDPVAGGPVVGGPVAGSPGVGGPVLSGPAVGGPVVGGPAGGRDRAGAGNPGLAVDGAPPADPASHGEVRPFLLTAGRVADDSAIAVETQVVTTELGQGSLPLLSYERRAIAALCSRPLSVAEVAAELRLHLGVVRVLVGDLSGDGLLAVHLPDTDVSSDVDTLLRVIRGLRAIG